MTREDCPGCNSEPGSWICLFHGFGRQSPKVTTYALVRPSYTDTFMTEGEAFAYVRSIHAGRSCGCKYCVKATPECELAGIRKA